MELRSENDIELYVKDVEKRGARMEIENSGYKLAGFDPFKSEILAETRRVNYYSLEDMVYRMELTDDKIMDVLDIKDTSATSIGCTLPPGINKISDNNLVLKSLLPDELRVNITIDDIRLRSSSNSNITIRFAEKNFSIQF